MSRRRSASEVSALSTAFVAFAVGISGGGLCILLAVGFFVSRALRSTKVAFRVTEEINSRPEPEVVTHHVSNTIFSFSFDIKFKRTTDYELLLLLLFCHRCPRPYLFLHSMGLVKRHILRLRRHLLALRVKNNGTTFIEIEWLPWEYRYTNLEPL